MNRVYLKICPWCGSDLLEEFASRKPSPIAFISCVICGAQGPTAKDLLEATEKWETLIRYRPILGAPETWLTQDWFGPKWWVPKEVI